MKFETVKAYYGSSTLYRVTKIARNGEMDTIHIYNNERVADTITELLNNSLSVDSKGKINAS
jgi:hypothetical protein